MKRMKLAVVILLAATLVAACGGGAAQPSAVPAPAKATEPAAQPKATEPAVQAKATEPVVQARPTESPVKPTAAPTAKPAEPPTPTAAPKPTAAPSPTPAPTQEQAPTGSAGLDFFAQTMRAQLAQKAWRSETTIDDAGTVSKTTLEFAAPDRLHLVTGKDSETIAIGDAVYMRQQGGAWSKMPGAVGGAITSMLDPKNVDDLLEMIEVTSFKFAGAELLDGRPTWVYDYNTSMSVGSTTIKSKSRIWIGVTDKLPYKGTGESESILHPGGLSKSTSIYSYPSQIKIEAPM